MKKCKDCQYYKASEVTASIGFCRCNPPVENGSDADCYPYVTSTGWCGKFKSKAEEINYDVIVDDIDPIMMFALQKLGKLDLVKQLKGEKEDEQQTGE